MAAVFAAIEAGDLASLRATAASQLAAKDENGNTPLIAAAYVGWLEGVQTLLNLGSDVRATDLAGRTATLVAAGEGHVDVLRALLSVDKSACFAASKSGNTALHRAAVYDHPEAVQLLLDAGASLNTRNGEGATALSRAARWNACAVLGLLLGARADPSVADDAGRTPAEWAQSKGHTEALELLRAAEEDATAAGDAGADAGEHTGEAGELVDEEMYYYDENGEEEYIDYAELGLPVRVEGWMAKQGHFFRTWKNRWFVLDGRTMWYYAKEGATKPKGIINMVAGTDVIIEEKYSKPFCFTLITPSKRFILQAADDDEMAEWIEAIQNNLECVDPDASGTVADVADED